MCTRSTHEECGLEEDRGGSRASGVMGMMLDGHKHGDACGERVWVLTCAHNGHTHIRAISLHVCLWVIHMMGIREGCVISRGVNQWGDKANLLGWWVVIFARLPSTLRAPRRLQCPRGLGLDLKLDALALDDAPHRWPANTHTQGETRIGTLCRARVGWGAPFSGG